MDNKFIYVYLTAFLVLIMGFTSCTSDNVDDYYTDQCDTTKVTFSNTVQPILDRNCMSCHFAGNSSGVNLETYIDVKLAADNGSLSGSINHLPDYTAMPLNNMLDDCAIAKIDKWIENGTLNN